jgi:putative endonuclease
MSASAAGLGRERGVRGERIAGELLEREGYTVRARNYRSRIGEIDIVAEKDGIVAFVEVKSWAAFGQSELEFSINRRKRSRIIDTARLYIASNADMGNKKTRFDVVFIGQGDSGCGVRHIEDAFSGDVR